MQKKPITNKLLWIFAVGQFGWSLLAGIVSNWMVYYYTGTADENGLAGIFGSNISNGHIFLGLTLFGLVMAVGRIFDAITDPLIASWSDRAKFKGGRRIPFMKAIAIPFALVTIALFVLPATGSIAVNDTLVFVLMIVFYLFMTIYCTPYNALIAELGDTQEHRINVSTYISFTYIAGLSISYMLPNIAGFLEGSLGQEGSIRMAVAIMSTIACIAMLVPSLYIKEREYLDAEPSETPAFSSLIKTFQNGMFRRFVYSDVIYFFALTLFQTGLAFYETKLMKIPDTFTFLLTALMTFLSVCQYPLVNKLAPKLGKKKLIITGFFLYSVVFLITFLCGEGLFWGILVAVMASIPMAILGILPQACVADVAELSRLETGEDRSGMFFAARTFAFKMGQAIALAVFTSMTVSATEGAYRSTALVAFICCVIGACLFFLFKEKEILAKIEQLKGPETKAE